METPKVKVTKTEQMLIDGLQLFPLKEGQRLRIFLMMDTEAQMLKMCQYMAKNLDATADELMAKAVQITGGLK